MPPSAWRRALAAGAAAALFLALAFTPYLVAGYGEPLFEFGSADWHTRKRLVRVTTRLEPAVTYGAVVSGLAANPVFAWVFLVHPLRGRLVPLRPWAGIRGTVVILTMVYWVAHVCAWAASRDRRSRWFAEPEPLTTDLVGGVEGDHAPLAIATSPPGDLTTTGHSN